MKKPRRSLGLLMTLVMVVLLVLSNSEQVCSESEEVTLEPGSYVLLDSGLKNTSTWETITYSKENKLKSSGNISIDLNGKTLACEGISTQGKLLIYGDTFGGNLDIGKEGVRAWTELVFREISGRNGAGESSLAIIRGDGIAVNSFNGKIKIIDSNVFAMDVSGSDRPWAMMSADFGIDISGNSEVYIYSGYRTAPSVQSGLSKITMEFPLEAYYTTDLDTFADPEKCVVAKYNSGEAIKRANGKLAPLIIIIRSPLVNFDANGGAVSPEVKTLEVDMILKSLPTPKKDGYVFLGWYDSEIGGKKITTSTVFKYMENTVYARWAVAPPQGKTLTYNGKTQTGVAAGPRYTVDGTAKATKVGSYTAKVTLKSGDTWTDGTTAAKTIKWTINKAANPLSVKAKTAAVKYSTIKKKAQAIGVTKVIAFTKKGQGKLTYTKASGNKKIVINKTTGKVTVKKGLKKGTYKVKVKIKAAGNANYKASAVKTVTFKLKVK